MQSLTHIVHYREHQISIVGFEMLDGWHLAVQVKPAWKPAWPAWRDKENTYESFGLLQKAGLAWAHCAIDDRLNTACAQPA